MFVKYCMYAIELNNIKIKLLDTENVYAFRFSQDGTVNMQKD